MVGMDLSKTSTLMFNIFGLVLCGQAVDLKSCEFIVY